VIGPISIPQSAIRISFLLLGLASWQALVCLLVGIQIVRLVASQVAKPSRKYGVPHPVICRFPFVVLGANIPAVIRAMIAVGWYGVQTYLPYRRRKISELSRHPGIIVLGGRATKERLRQRTQSRLGAIRSYFVNHHFKCLGHSVTGPLLQRHIACQQDFCESYGHVLVGLFDSKTLLQRLFSFFKLLPIDCHFGHLSILGIDLAP
jgi:hypothetical protein